MWEGTLNYYKKLMKTIIFSGNSNLDYYKKMVELCKNYNIKLNVFTTAVHKSQLQLIEETKYS